MELTTLTVRVAPDEAAYLDQVASQHEGILSKQGVMRLLLQQARSSGWDPLDASATLGLAKEPKASPSSSSSYIPKSINTPTNKNKGKNEGKNATVYPPEFQAFWKAYQALPQKAAKQSKPLALLAWSDVTAHTSPDDLLRAVRLAQQVQQRELNSERGFTVAMPDCFRWLRDECFHALLEAPAPTNSRVVICDETF